MPTVGEILAAERRRQGKSLQDVVDGTKIRSRLLDALEHGRYEELPSPAYVKGFIQSYARYLEVPCEPLLRQYSDEAPASGGGVSPTDRYLAEIPAETIVPARDRAHAIPREVWIIAAVGVILLLLVTCTIMRLFGAASNGANTNPTATPPSSDGSASAGVTASPGATTTVNTASNGFKLRVTVRDGMASWIKVTADGLVAIDETLQAGNSREWLVTDTATVVIGKPSAVVVTRDGKVVKLPTQANAQIELSAQ